MYDERGIVYEDPVEEWKKTLCDLLFMITNKESLPIKRDSSTVWCPTEPTAWREQHGEEK
jgi:hypothetical protein